MVSNGKNFKEVFRQNLKRFRKERGYSQSELSRKSHFEDSYLGKIERGNVDPSLESIKRICNALDVKPRELLLPHDSTNGA